MLRTLIRLPDGRELFSGPDAGYPIQTVKLTQCVNDANELSLGSACSSMLEVMIQTPKGGLEIAAGDEMQVYKVDEEDKRHLVGYFTAEKPTRATANTLRITAYDRMSWLDKDLTQWLKGLEGWPYSLRAFARMVCEACGLTLENSTIPNADYLVQAFSGQGITGRKLMQWVGQIAGRFCRATAAGQIELAWYTPSGVKLTPDGEHFYFQNGLSYETYQVQPIEKVWLKLTQDDVGVVWPDDGEEKNTYIITGNFLLTAMDSDALLPVAKNLYEMLKNVTYTPCRVQLPASVDIHAGHTVTITDRQGKTFTSFVMTKTQSGQLDTLESTGSHRRDSTDAVNNEDYQALNSKLLELRKQSDGLSVRVSEHQADLKAVHTSVSDMQMKSDELNLQITTMDSSTMEALDAVNKSMQSLQREVSAKVTPEAVQLQIQTAMDDGAEKVVTKTGFTFDEAGLSVEKLGSEMKTQITENGMVVYQNSQEVLTANNVGVAAKNLHANTYLIVGGNSRFEDYGYNRTGCFWIGG